MTQKIPEHHRSKGRKRPSISVAIIAAFFIVFLFSERYERNQRNKVQTSTGVSGESAARTSIEVYPDVLRVLIEKRLGDGSAGGDSRVQKLAFDDRSYTKPVIRIIGNNDYDKRIMRLRMLQDAKKVLGIVFDQEQTLEATLYLLRPMQTIFGFTRNKGVIMFKLTRETYTRVDWDRINPEQLPSLVDYAYQLKDWY